MTPRDIILANLGGANAPRCGFTFDGGRLNDFVSGGVRPSGYEQRRWQGEDGVEYYDDEWGNVWVRMMGGSAKGEIHKPVLEDWSALATLTLPEYDVATCADVLRKTFEHDSSERFRIAHIGGWVFDNARYLRKMEIYFMDMVLYPNELHELHDRVAQVYERKIRAAGEAGADAIGIGEDLGTQLGLLFSPEMFRLYFKELYARLMGLAHEYGMKVLMHSCGQNREILDDLVECGVDAFQFDQPAVYDMQELATLFRKHNVALWAPVDIQKILPTGNREFIEKETERLVRLFEGRLILKNYPDLPGIGVQPEWDDWFYRRALALNGIRGAGET
jgi:uroporphyrinogen decarboxylase